MNNTLKGGDIKCGNTDIQRHVTKDSGEAINPVISPAISLNNDREQPKTEIMSNQSGNKSGDKSSDRVNCYKCKYRGGLVGDAHSECRNPLIGETDRLMSILYVSTGLRSGVMKRLNISLDPHGVKNGWATWPINFDPVWIETCEGFTELNIEE